MLEILIYIGLLALLSAGVIQVGLTLASGAKELRSDRLTAQAAELALETLVREIRQGSEVLVAASVFGSNPGTLVLRTVQSPGSQVQVSRTFFLASSRLQKQDDSGPAEFLTGPEAPISSLIFWHLPGANSDLVTVEITFQDKTFYASAVLRAKY